jgi:hypothetical protein
LSELVEINPNRKIINMETLFYRHVSMPRRRSMGALLSALLILCVACSCSRPIKPKSDLITVELGSLTFTRYFDLLEKVTFEGKEAIRLSDFIDSAVTVYPDIYAYRVIGSDGFYAAKKGSPDNTWEQIQKGYLRLSDRRVTFEPSLGLEGRYYVKDVVSIELLRKIDVQVAEEKDSTFLIINQKAETFFDSTDAFYNGRSGIKLSEFIQPLTSATENYVYHLISARGEDKTFSWSEVQTGWWLKDLDLTKFNPDLGASSRITHLQTIELTPKAE